MLQAWCTPLPLNTLSYGIGIAACIYSMTLVFRRCPTILFQLLFLRIFFLIFWLYYKCMFRLLHDFKGPYRLMFKMSGDSVRIVRTLLFMHGFSEVRTCVLIHSIISMKRCFFFVHAYYIVHACIKSCFIFFHTDLLHRYQYLAHTSTWCGWED